MFEEAKVGDRVWSFQNEWGSICNIKDNSSYPLTIKFDNGNTNTYTLEGKSYESDKRPTLFWNEIKYEIPSKPLPDLPVDSKVVVWDDETKKCKRHFSHFEGGKIHCFRDGATSWTEKSTISWKHWEIEKEETC